MPELECPLHAAAASDPDLPALEAPECRLTFRELDEWVEGTALQLRARLARRPVEKDASDSLGASAVWQDAVATGGPVALWMENDWRMVVLLLASLRAGIVMCPLSTRLPSPAGAVDQIGAQMLISDRAGAKPDDLLKRAGVGGTVVHPPEKPATIVFTSGSAGRPKAALLSFGNHYYNATGSNENIAVGPRDRWLLSLPLYHVGGLAILFRCLLGRGTIVLDDDMTNGAVGVTHVSLVSTQLYRLLRSGEKLPNLKAVLLGGSAISPGLIDGALDRGLPLHTSYGMTEMASQVATTMPGASREELLTSGRVLRHRELRVAMDGRILVRGRTRFKGYVEDRDLLEPFDDDGWYETGDLGFIDGGLLNVTGRLDNMFVSGGENVMPEEIERVLSTHPKIRRAVVVPVDDDEFGRRPVAFVDSGGDRLDPAEISDWIGERLPRFKIPTRFFPWPERDDESGMKIDRAFLERKADNLMRG